MRKAFTLIEIMIVVVIIAVLAAIAIPGILRARMNTFDGVAKSNLKATATALENYLAAQGAYPSDVATLVDADPSYIEFNFFDGAAHDGFNYSVDSLTTDVYRLNATPVSCNSTGSKVYSIQSGMAITVANC